MAPPKSDAWKHFSKNNDGTATCRHCSKKLKTSGNTTNLMGHIVRLHKLLVAQKSSAKIKLHEKTCAKSAETAGPSQEQESEMLKLASEITQKLPDPEYPDTDDDTDTVDENASSSTVYSEAVTPMTASASVSRSNSDLGTFQPSVKKIFQNITSYGEGGRKFEDITNAILFMICKDMQPLNIVENEGFRHLMKTVVPQYKLPSRDTFTRRLDTKYEVVSQKIKEKLSRIDSVTITTDIWSDTMQTRSFLGVTVHYADQMKVCSFTLGVFDLNERHTSAYLSEKLLEICDQWHIPKEKITAVVTDSGANIVKAVDLSFGKNLHIPCCAHTLNLVAEKSISSVPNLLDIISKVKSIVTWFKQSVVASDELRKQTSKKLIQEVQTRWNSKYYMLERFIELRAEINDIIIRHITAPAMVSALEIQQIEEILKLLRTLEAATKELCGEKYVTASKIIPMIYCLKNKIQTIDCNLEMGFNLKEVLQTELQKRFGHMEEVRLLAIATLLDPRFKRIHFQNPLACSRAVSYLRTMLQEMENEAEAAEETRKGEEKIEEGK